eukprot:PhF_6_TR20544/c0_g1_i1/m.29668
MKAPITMTPRMENPWAPCYKWTVVIITIQSDKRYPLSFQIWCTTQLLQTSNCKIESNQLPTLDVCVRTKEFNYVTTHYSSCTETLRTMPSCLKLCIRTLTSLCLRCS